MFDTLGLSADENRVYLFLLDSPHRTLAETRGELALGAHELKQILRSLEEKGLVSRSGERPARLIPAPPDLALEALLIPHAEEIEALRLKASRMGATFREQVSKRDELPIELATGQQAAKHRWVQVQRAARREVILLDRPPYLHITGPNPEELRQLSRGVRYRVIYDRKSLEALGKIDSIKACMAAGEEARILEALPLKLLASDQQLGLVYDIHADSTQDALVVRASPLLSSLYLLFEMLWKTAMPLYFDVSNQAQPSGPTRHVIDGELLELMAAGFKDESIAQRLDITPRTVRRRVKALMNELGVRSRFQAGMEIMRRGLL